MSAPVEGKVSAQAQGTGAGLALYGFLLWVLGVTVWGVPADAAHAVAAAAAVPAPVIGLLALLPVGLGYACGYMAKHTPRPIDRPVIIKSDATTAPVDGPALNAVIDDLRAALARPVKVTLNGQTVATTRLAADTSASDAALAQVRDNIEGRQMTEAGPDTTPDA